MSDYLFLGVASIVVTWAHAAEETEGEGGPLWRYLARLTGAFIPDDLGGLLVAGVVPLGCTAAAVAGYGGATLWLSVLAGLRLGDALCSHWLPWLAGCRPNPGQWSALYYLAEGGLIVALAPVSWPAVLAGAAVFAGVWPVLWLLAKVR